MQQNSDHDRSRLPRKHRRGLTRIAAACERCRKRKQKCDSKVPTCGPCEAVGAKCILSDRLTIVSGSGGDDSALGIQVERLKAEVSDLKQQLYEAQSQSSGHSAAAVSPYNSTFATDGVARHHSFPTAHIDSPSRRDTIPVRQPYTGRIFRPTFSTNFASRVDGSDKSSAWTLFKDDHSVETPAPTPSMASNMPLESYGPMLVDIFFEHRWPHLPLLHKPSWLRDHYYPFAGGGNVSSITRFQVNMVFALAALEQTRNSNQEVFSHHDFFNIAVREANFILMAEDFECITCLLLLCMYGRTEPQSINMWHTTGLALRIALGIDMHRAESVVKMGLLQAEMSKRLFWSVYTMDRSMSNYLGRPLGVQDADINLPFPLQLTDDDLELYNTDTVIERDRASTNDMSTFIHLIKLRRINANIYSMFHSVRKTWMSPEELDRTRLDIYSQLNEWLVTAPRYTASALSMFQSPEWFQIAYHLAILSLHRPSFAQPAPSIDALQLCADSSISLVSLYGTLYAKNKVSYSFVALSSIFMAAVTMLYSLRASPQVRKDLTKQVIETNINSCLVLIRGIANGREVAERAAQTVSSLGEAVLSFFEQEDQESYSAKQQASNSQDVDREFLSWFGLKSRVITKQKPVDAGLVQAVAADATTNTIGTSDEPLATLSVDMAWEELFAQGFGMDSTTGIDFFPHTAF